MNERNERNERMNQRYRELSGFELEPAKISYEKMAKQNTLRIKTNGN